MARLTEEDVVTIKVLRQRGQSASAVARTLGVTEGAVRYHERRAAKGAADGRGRQKRLAAAYAGAIEAFLEARERPELPPNVHELFDFLVEQHDYPGSTRSLERYMRQRYGRPPVRTYRRVETVAGAQTQTD